MTVKMMTLGSAMLFLMATMTPQQALAQGAKAPSLSQATSACKSDGSGCAAMVSMMAQSEAKPKAMDKAIELASLACQAKKNRDACYAASQYLLSTNDPSKLDRGLELLGRSCSDLFLDRCLEFNRRYLAVNKEQQRQILWTGSLGSSNASLFLKYHCEKQGEASACKARGDEFYFRNTIPEKSTVSYIPLAIQAYRPSCDANDAQSCSRLVELYAMAEPKRNVQPDLTVSRAFAVKACRLGQTQHCAAGGAVVVARANEIDPSLSYEEQMLIAEQALADGKLSMAMTTLQRLAKEGRDEANYRLGMLNLTGGNGVRADRAAGLGYLEKSGHPDAAFLRAQLALQDDDSAGYNKYMDKAYWAGNKEAEVWWLNRQKAYLAAVEERDRRTIAQARENDRQKAAYEAELIKRAMNNYYLPQNKEATVCGMFRNGGGLQKRCMPRKYYLEKYVK